MLALLRPPFAASITEGMPRGLGVACPLIIVLGAGLFGAAMGAWRSPLQAAFNMAKFPMVLLLTALGTALINGMLAPLLGIPLGLRESLRLVLTAFGTASLILGAFAPLTLFLIWNVPPIDAASSLRHATYGLVLLLQVAIIALAGIVANVRLHRWLAIRSGDGAAATRVVLSWLAINLFLGAQLSWNLRPFIGNPEFPVRFVRADAFAGNFFEGVLAGFYRASNRPPNTTSP